MANSQHRCVFVGNIPYDATEEQLKQICEEVGPVVSFRLVSDRETGKPKGYGFCEYRDEETALSARRNLQGYEINGRQLRVDFAENDKGVDRNREQGRGGPGFASNFDNQKQSSGPANAGDPSLNQPVGLAVAAAAASVMAGALGDPHASSMGQNQNSVQSQSNVSGNDPLTIHLASLSKNQLYEVMSEMKALIQQNQQQARDILVTNPQLTKALFQAQIMLGMVPSQMLPLFRQTSNQLSQQSLQTGQPEPLTQSGQIHSGQSQMQPAQQNQVQIGQHGQIPVNQSQPPNNISMQQLMQPPQHIAASPQIQVIQQPQSQITQSLLQSVQPESQGLNLPVQPAMQTSAHNVLMQPRVSSILSSQSQQPSVQPTLGILHQPPLPQQPRPSLQSFMPPAQVQNLPPQSLGFQPSITLHQLPQVPFQSGNISTTMGMVFQKHSQPPLPNQPPPPQPYQMGSGSATGAVSLAGSDVICQGTGQSNMPSSAGILHIGPGVAVQGGRGSNLVPGSSSMGPDLSWAPGLPPSGGVQFSAVPLGIGEQVGICGELTTGMTASVGPPNIDDGNRAYSAVGSASGGMTAGSSERIGSSPSHSPSHMPVEGMPHPQQQVSQGIQLPPEMNSLLQQVMGLTQEQINSLPPEQRQQVLHLQQTLQLQQTLH